MSWDTKDKIRTKITICKDFFNIFKNEINVENRNIELILAGNQIIALNTLLHCDTKKDEILLNLAPDIVTCRS
jgi:hypothetical protein